MAILTSLSTLHKIDEYADLISDICKMEKHWKADNHLTQVCENQLPLLEQTRTEITSRRGIVFAYNASSFSVIKAKIADLFDKVTNPFTYLTVNPVPLEAAKEVVRTTRFTYMDCFKRIEDICNQPPLSNQFSADDLKKATDIFSQIKERSPDLTLSQFVEAVEEASGTAADNPVFQSSPYLKMALGLVKNLGVNARLCFDFLDKLKTDLIEVSSTIALRVEHDIMFEKIEATEKFESAITDSSGLKKSEQVSERIKNLSDKFNEIYKELDKVQDNKDVVEKKPTLKH